MKKQKGHFNVTESSAGEIFWKKKPMEILGDSEIKITQDVNDLSTNLQSVFTDTTEKPLKKLNDVDRVMYKNISSRLYLEKHKPISAESKSGRYKHIKSSLDDHVDKILNGSFPSESKSDDLEGHGIEKITIPSNIIDNDTKLEVLLGLNLSGYTKLLTKASNLIDEMYKRIEIQIEQQYRNALDKFSTQ